MIVFFVILKWLLLLNICIYNKKKILNGGDEVIVDVIVYLENYYNVKYYGLIKILGILLFYF